MRRIVFALGLVLLLLAAWPAALPAPGGQGPAIRVNQLGYRPGDRKVALVAGAPRRFVVQDSATGRAVFEGVAGPPGSTDPASGDRVATLDFSALRAPGQYVVTAPGFAPSPAFRIDDAVYREPLQAALAMFHYHRCGGAVAGGSPFDHAACHLADAEEWGVPGSRRNVTGGWHDAGDYGKYVPAAGVAVWHLAAVHDLVRPPGLLDELRWELDWLLRMQRDDGGVHHKVTVARWTGDRPPDADRDPRYLFGVSSAATATFAASAARAARLFQPHDPAYAGRLLAAAELSWRWLEQHPAIVPRGGFTNPPGVETGAYEDDDDRDQRFWAATELWRATGQARYRAVVLASVDRWTPFDYPASWAQVQNLAYGTLVESDSPLDAPARTRLAAALTERSGWLVDSYAGRGYRVALAPTDYYWGSNGVALGRALQLLTAHRVSAREAYRDAALDQLHYVFGRNALGKSFVTGLGADPVRRPTHQPSNAHPQRPVLPGLLVGGPNAQYEGLSAATPALAYKDDSKLYGVNEPSIYWNAALAHVLAYFVPAGR